MNTADSGTITGRFTGRRWSDGPNFKDVDRHGNVRYIGHLGNQEYDDTLALSAEVLPSGLMTLDFAAIELRVLANMSFAGRLALRFLPVLPDFLYRRIVLGNKINYWPLAIVPITLFPWSLLALLIMYLRHK